jgi:hypothetical protein
MTFGYCLYVHMNVCMNVGDIIENEFDVHVHMYFSV